MYVQSLPGKCLKTVEEGRVGPPVSWCLNFSVLQIFFIRLILSQEYITTHRLGGEAV